MYDFWHFWDQTNCPFLRGVLKEKLDCKNMDELSVSFT